MLRVGIHDNVIVHKAVKNDRGTLIVGMKQLRDFNALTDLNAATDTTNFEADENDFMFFPFNSTDNTGQKLETKEIMTRIAEVKDPLNHILQQYLTADAIKWDILAGTGITNENIDVKIKEDTTLDKIYSNIVDQFMKMITPFLGQTTKKFRAIFPRQSAAKHYPAIRRRYLGTYPFLESMSVPVDQSKLRFSKYELDNKLDNPSPVQKTAAPKAPAANVTKLFSGTNS